MTPRLSTQYIIIHGTWTKPELNPTAQDLYDWNKARFPTLKDNPYHIYIDRGGAVIACRNLSLSGAHTRKYNAVSIGVVLAGGRSGDGWLNNYTNKQMLNLRGICTILTQIYPDAEVVGHRNLDDRQCPGFDVKAWWKNE